MHDDRYHVHRYTGHIFIMDTVTRLAVMWNDRVRWFVSRSQAEYVCRQMNTTTRERG